VISDPTQRKAGILLHVSSLPGRYGIGDFGHEAFEFVDFLKNSGQRIWQILPLNQVNGGSEHSPYSPLSAFAGNILFISPEILAGEKLLPPGWCRANRINSSAINYPIAEEIKQSMLDEAFRIFQEADFGNLKNEFASFCRNEEFWLKDYARFIVLKAHHGMRSWNKWPQKFRDGDQVVLDEFETSFSYEIEKIRFSQFIFSRQWHNLKKYCHINGIEILGDIPIYVGYDSADTWSHPGLFKLKENKEMEVVAGVPPDYFNDNGQLWNMPIYNWTALQETDYTWWIQRLKKNLELYDLVRLDHFRGFSAYWEVGGGAETAREGHWRPGPGKAFFKSLKRHFPAMPFIAEDLGDIDQSVYNLRDAFHLPGMRVLQFAFGDDFPHSIHLVHRHSENSLVYTGTHDNNTLRGWYTRDLNSTGRRSLKRYLPGLWNRYNLHKRLIQLVYQSVARIAIVPMQDILGLGTEARMNFPSTVTGNWMWRLKKRDLRKKLATWLGTNAHVCGRSLSAGKTR
jgi:4-alpha-glucanotransferase